MEWHTKLITKRYKDCERHTGMDIGFDHEARGKSRVMVCTGSLWKAEEHRK